jgi:hypothetical protein
MSAAHDRMLATARQALGDAEHPGAQVLKQAYTRPHQSEGHVQHSLTGGRSRSSGHASLRRLDRARRCSAESSSWAWPKNCSGELTSPATFAAKLELGRSLTLAEALALANGLSKTHVHIVYWQDPWQRRPRHALVALASMLLINFALLNLLGLSQPLLWLYPALIAGAGLRTPMAVVGIGFTALAGTAPLAFDGGFVHPVEPLQALARRSRNQS